MKTIAFIFLAFFCLQSQARSTFEKTFETYKAAEKADSFIRFDMKSSKIGLFTTSFTGFVKRFNIEYEESKDKFSNIIIRFNVTDIDTDTSGRNEKLWTYCLDKDNHPIITVSLPIIKKSESSQNVSGKLNLRGEEHDINLSITSASDKSIVGSAELSLKTLKIPDPSILVAHVKDEIKISFHLLK